VRIKMISIARSFAVLLFLQNSVESRPNERR